jgi:hypothetical protein
MNNSNWTGRTSRTMNEAFGAHCRQSISSPYEPMKTSEKLFCCVVAAIGLAAVILMFIGVIK